MKVENNHISLNSEKGQAVVEYILVVVVTIAILVGLATQIFSPLQKFLQGYMGSYVECLLETGELPGTLGGDYESKAMSECRAKMEAASGELGGANGSTGSEKNGGNSGEASTEGASSQAAGEGNATNGSSDGAGYSANSGSGSGSGSRSMFRRGSRTPRRSLGMRGGGSNEDGQTIALNESASGAGGLTGSQIRYIRRTERKIVTSGRMSEDEIKQIKKRTPQSGSRVSTQEVSAITVKKVPLKINTTPSIQAKEEENTSLGLGGFLRYLLIAAIIVAILVFVGRQAFQMSKSFND